MDDYSRCRTCRYFLDPPDSTYDWCVILRDGEHCYAIIGYPRYKEKED